MLIGHHHQNIYRTKILMSSYELSIVHCAGGIVSSALFYVVLRVYCSLFSVKGERVVVLLQCAVCSLNGAVLRGRFIRILAPRPP